MKHIRIMTLMFFLFVQHNVFCQNIVGRVFDSTETPLEFVNVVFLSINDSTFINGTVTDTYGNFSIDSKGKQGFLRFTRIGYSPLVIQNDGLHFKKVVLYETENTLNEVVVKSNLPKTRLKGEGMVTTVTGSFLEKAGTLEHVLSYIPNLIVIGGEVQVLGRGVPEYYLNGHKVIDQMELKILKSDEIKNIEVINNPGARYGTATKCVIRITTKSRNGDGWGFDLNSSYGVNEQKRFSTTDVMGLFFSHKKIDVSGSLYCDYSNTEDDKLLQQFTYLKNVFEKSNNIIQKHQVLNPYAKLAASYQINDSSSLGLRISYNRYAKNNGYGTLDATVTDDTKLTESSHSDYELLGSSTAVTTNAYYAGYVGNMSIDVNADYYWYDQNEYMGNYEWVESNNNTPEYVNTSRSSTSCQLASKINLSLPFWGGRFLWGGEFSNCKRKSKYDVLPVNLINNERSIVKEYMYSAFCDYNRHIGNLNVQMGLRYEKNDFNYYSHGEYVPTQSKKYNDLFPSLSVSYPFGKSQMQITYASDIKRPSYYQLRDGIQYDNRYIYESGNPFLFPSKSRNFGVFFSWNWMTFSTIYSYVSDEICSIVKPYEENVQISMRQPENMDSYERVQTNVSFSPSVGFWHPQLKAGMTKQWFYFPSHGSKSLCNPKGIFHVNNTFDAKWFSFSLFITAQTEGNTSNCFTYSSWNTDFSLYKSLLKDRFIIRLYANDLFGTANQRRIIYSGEQSSTYIKSYSSSSVVLTLRYVFNVKNDKYKGTGAGLRQRSRL